MCVEVGTRHKIMGTCGKKYIVPFYVDIWIRNLVKILNNVSIIWEVVILAFPLIGNGVFRFWVGIQK
jgi:hypothetical protein